MAPNVLLWLRDNENTANTENTKTNSDSATDNSESTPASSTNNASSGSSPVLTQPLTDQPWFIAVVVIGSLAVLAAVCFFGYTYYRTKHPRRRTSREYANYQPYIYNKKSASSSPTASLKHLSLPGYVAWENSKSGSKFGHKHSKSLFRKLANQQHRALELEAQREMALQKALKERPLPAPPRPTRPQRTEGLFEDADTDAESLMFIFQGSIHQRNSFTISTDSFPRPPTLTYNPKAHPRIHQLTQQTSVNQIVETDLDSLDDEQAVRSRHMSLRSETKAYKAGLMRSQSEHHQVYPIVKATESPMVPPLPGSMSLRSVSTNQTGFGSLLGVGIASAVDVESNSYRASLMPVPLDFRDSDAAMVVSHQLSLEQLQPLTFEEAPPVPKRSSRRVENRPRSKSLENPAITPGSDIVKVSVSAPDVMLHKSSSVGHVRNAASFASTIDGEISPGIDSYEVLLARENSNRQVRKLNALFKNRTGQDPTEYAQSSAQSTPVSSYFPPTSVIASSMSSYSDMSAMAMPPQVPEEPERFLRYFRSVEEMNVTARIRPNYMADRSRSVDANSRKRRPSLSDLRAQHMRSQSSKLPPGDWQFQESILDVTGAALRPAAAPLLEGEIVSEFVDEDSNVSLSSATLSIPRRSSKRTPVGAATVDPYPPAFATPPSTPPRSPTAIPYTPAHSISNSRHSPSPESTLNNFKPISRSKTMPVSMIPDTAPRYPAIEPEIADRSLLVYRPVTRAPVSLHVKKTTEMPGAGESEPRRWQSVGRLSFDRTQVRDGEGEMTGRLDGPLGDIMPAF